MQFESERKKETKKKQRERKQRWLTCHVCLASYVILFELMVVNNWSVMMDAYALMTNEWSRIYFMVNFIVTVLIVMNVIIAFVINLFLSHVSVDPSEASGACCCCC